jgi:ABC-type nitrate/sulfonate/bicarbonate transport system permease component
MSMTAIDLGADGLRDRGFLRRGAARSLRLAAIPVALIVLWEIMARSGVLPGYLVGPSTIFATAVEMVTSGELWTHLSVSLVRCYSGFALGASLGIAAGLVTAMSPALRSFCDPLVSLSYPVPKVAMLPILMVWLGLGDASKIAIIALSCFYPVYINAYQGALSVNPVLIWAARTFGANRVRIFLRVIVPAALPSIFAGLRVALGLAFILLFAAEMVSANTGLGYLIVQAQLFQRFDIMFVAVATIGVFGFASDRLLLAIQRRVLAYEFHAAG